jgi:hypothetical protein
VLDVAMALVSSSSAASNVPRGTRGGGNRRPARRVFEHWRVLGPKLTPKHLPAVVGSWARRERWLRT